jgi:hypothetical protein
MANPKSKQSASIWVCDLKSHCNNIILDFIMMNYTTIDWSIKIKRAQSLLTMSYLVGHRLKFSISGGLNKMKQNGPRIQKKQAQSWIRMIDVSLSSKLIMRSILHKIEHNWHRLLFEI